MTKLGKFWTDSVAYVALLAGAGLSIAGNVANVLRTRGQSVDTLDIVLAVAFPALVVLMVEVFVSSRWRGLSWPMQVLRWLGTLSIGAVAMRVSWVHLHALMVSRGQEADVAILGPLAIDALAIMATALILAGRGRVQPVGQLAMGFQYARPIGPMPLANVQVATPVDMDIFQDTVEANRQAAEVDIFARLASEMDTDNPTLPVPVSPAPVATARKILSTELQDEAAILALAGRVNGLAAGEISELLAGHYGVSSRTIRRQPWWTAAMQGLAPDAA